MNKLKSLQAVWAEQKDEPADEDYDIFDWNEGSDPERWWRE